MSTELVFDDGDDLAAGAETLYFVRRRGKVYGPFTEGRLEDCLGEEIFTANDSVSPDKVSWEPLGAFLRRDLEENAEYAAADGVPDDWAAQDDLAMLDDEGNGEDATDLLD